MAEVERRIEDVVLRQQTFSRLKHELIRQAMQLSILCDCDVQLFVHSARVGAQGVQGGTRVNPRRTFESENLR